MIYTSVKSIVAHWAYREDQQGEGNTCIGYLQFSCQKVGIYAILTKFI